MESVSLSGGGRGFQFPGHNSFQGTSFLGGVPVAYGPGGLVSTTGSDTIYLDTTFFSAGFVVSREDVVFLALTHEIAHENSDIQNAAASLAASALSGTGYAAALAALPTESARAPAQLEVERAAEHVLIAQAVEQFTIDNDIGQIQVLATQNSVAAYKSVLANSLKDLLNMTEQEAASAAEAVYEERSNGQFGDSMNITGLGEYGNVTSYVNEQGDSVSVGGFYSDEFIGYYGIETQNGVDVSASATFGGHMRGLADFLGLDGDFGLQGRFARSNEGVSGNGTSANPVMIDLDGDGLEISTNPNISFDWDEDGFVEQSA